MGGRHGAGERATLSPQDQGHLSIPARNDRPIQAVYGGCAVGVCMQCGRMISSEVILCRVAASSSHCPRLAVTRC
jgi:hypothetical protein